MENTKLVDILDPQSGKTKETIIGGASSYTTDEVFGEAFSFLESTAYDGKSYRRSLREALIQTPDANNMLRDGIRLIAFSEYAGMPTSYGAFTRTMQSNKPEEYYLRDGSFGRLSRVRSGEPAPKITRRFEGAAVIQNFKYDGIAEILGDDIRFDRLNIIRQTAELMGRNARMTEEAQVYDVITTTANYNRSKTAGDNDVGANTAARDLTHANYETALAIIATAKDRVSGDYLGLRADTIIVGPLMEYPVMKLLMSQSMQGAGGADASERGDLNVYRNSVRRVIVSPYLTDSYDWILADTRVPGVMFQQVEPFNVYQTTMTPDNRAWLERDVIEYKVMGYFGVGFVDDRGWVYNTSTTRPTL